MYCARAAHAFSTGAKVAPAPAVCDWGMRYFDLPLAFSSACINAEKAYFSKLYILNSAIACISKYTRRYTTRYTIKI